MIWNVLSTIAGAAVVVYGLSDIFLTLVHPHARGRLTRGIVAGIWAITSRFGRRARAASGPLAAICVVLSWAAIQAIGWALIYLPHVPDGFVYPDGIDPASYPDVLEALYFSLVSLSTLGFGEVVPADPFVRVLSPLQAVTGFALLTGGATWLLQLFPTLARRRSTALYLTLLGRASYPDHIAEADPVSASVVVHAVAQHIASAQVDLSQSPESYYFREGEKPTSLGHALPVAQALADAASASTHADLRVAGLILDDALEELGTCLRDNFGALGETRSDVIASFARDHA
ncbi:potassium channel family protein [Microbacterium sulfonylureivorans]|uniref:potassium channel family protein n=1 Tax=Microbacterium sulfonylureivorans TaxID=2486854 RepID=UPI000FDCCE79|nr:potassium channel family protein [Microbacterium sulfonylureivorans]